MFVLKVGFLSGLCCFSLCCCFGFPVPFGVTLLESNACRFVVRGPKEKESHLWSSVVEEAKIELIILTLGSMSAARANVATQS